MPSASEEMKEDLKEGLNKDAINSKSDDASAKKTTKRRTSMRLQNASKKPCFSYASSSSDEDESTINIDPASPASPASVKSSTSTAQNKNCTISKGKLTKAYSSKRKSAISFVVLKSDISKEGDIELWKVDGKSLLQKFVPIEDDNGTLYKSTSVYSGWTVNSKHLFCSVDVTTVRQTGSELIVKFNKESILKDKPAE